MNLISRPTDRGRQARVIKIERILYPKGLSMEANAAMRLICTGILFSTLIPSSDSYRPSGTAAH
jgi:hypothetical protein